MVVATPWGCRAILGIDDSLPIVTLGDDASSEAASNGPDTGALDTGAPLGDSPDDRPCTGLDAWNIGTKASEECAARRTFVVMGDVLEDIKGYCENIALAVAKTGRVVVACHDEVTADEGHLVMRTFQPKTPAFAVKALPIVKGSFADDVGHGVRLTGSRSAGDPDAVHAVYQTLTNFVSGPVLYRVVGASALGPEETAAVSVARSSLSVASDAAGNVAVSYADIAAPSDDRHGQTHTMARERLATSTAFSAPESLDSMHADTSTQVPGVGRARLRYGDFGRLHAAIFSVTSNLNGIPKYSVRTGGTFDTRGLERVDGPVRLSGQSIDLAVFGETKTAAYFSTALDAGPSLVVASWIALPSLFTTPPTYETLIPSGQIHRSEDAPFRQSLSLDVDKFGLLHLAVIVPTSPTLCTVEYRRQKRSSGVVSWVVDVIASNVSCDGSADPLVDLAVDDEGRPHIAYFTFNPTMRVEYATRFDR